MLRTIIPAVIATATIAVNQAEAETLIECGASYGREFFFDESKWYDSKIGNGRIALIRNGDNLDVVISDAVGLFSSTSQGGKVTLIDVAESIVTVLIDYQGGTKEIYSFDFERKKVAWSQHKMTGPFDKAHTMIADCK